MALGNERKTTVFYQGEWLQGNAPVIGAMDHGAWLGSNVFDGARWFEGVAPDLDKHCERVNRSAKALGMNPTMEPADIAELAMEGLRNFDGKTPVYVRPMYWAEGSGFMGVPPDPDTTKFNLALFESPMLGMDGMTLGVSKFRRPTMDCMPLDAKAGGLYTNNARCIMDARSRGFDNAIVLDAMGNVAETGSTNLFMVRDGEVFTPIANGTFLSGITRSRVIDLLRADGVAVHEAVLTIADFEAADEAFATGNHSKVVPVTGVESRTYQTMAVSQRARDLYIDWAKSAA
ncbi:MAG: branched-chain amino acid aminotransferase [Pseudomonadota bacterium]